MILDLDGDGLEITPLDKGIVFDANGDAIKTGTAWAGSDDGMLAWDRNGNGRIDSGQELFGDETVLANGKKAPHGFAALSDLDTGSLVNGVLVGAGDGVFDAQDAEYANLRVWRDLNQDGVSQANELQTLAEAEIVSIQLASTATSTNHGDAILTQSGNFTRTDGSTGEAGSFILAQNNFVRQFELIEVSDEAAALPDFKGGGWVRDLREAATLSPELIGLVNQIQDAPTRAGYKDAVGDLLREWGNDSAYDSASKQALKAGYGLILSDPLDAQEAGWMDMAIKAGDAERNAYRAGLTDADAAKFDAMRERMVGGLEKLYAYEAFTGYTFLDWVKVEGDALHYVPPTLQAPPQGRPVEAWVPLSEIIHANRVAVPSSQEGYIRVDIPVPLNVPAHVDTLWARLLDDATNNLMPTLRLSKYIDLVDLKIDEAGISGDFARFDAGMAALKSENAHEGAALLLDMYRVYGGALEGLGWNGTEHVSALIQEAVSNAEVRSAFEETGLNFVSAGTAKGTVDNDVFAGDAAANSFNADAGDDLVDGGQGDDFLNGGNGADTLLGGEGKDDLRSGDGNDVLDGGAGNDSYRFARGWGQDTVYNYDYSTDKLDAIEFAADIAPEDIVVTRSSTSLILGLKDGGDKITVNYYFDKDGASDYRLEEIRFADGTAWNIDQVKTQVLQSTDGADTLYGYASDDAISAGAGNDNVDGGNGNDILNGEAGDDRLSGGSGNDTLDGGAGNDYFDGGAGNDTYVFQADPTGAITDYISGFGDSAGNEDIIDLSAIAFDGGVTEANFAAWKSGSVTESGGHTYIHFGDDQIRLDGVLMSTLDHADFRFGSGATEENAIHGTDGMDAALTGTGADDVIYGLAGIDMLYGQAGNDVLDGGADMDLLYGGAGDDTIKGGAGSDWLMGEAGNDTYVFEADPTGAAIDRVYFGDSAGDQDIIDLSAVVGGVTEANFAAWKNGSMTQSGFQVDIRIGDDDHVLLLNMQMSGLDYSDFIFAGV